MAVIYKYPFPKAGEPTELKIRGFCEVVHAGIDGNGLPCLWALVMPEKEEETWTYMIVGTGQEFDIKQWCHLKTFTKDIFVFHLLGRVDQWDRSIDAP